MKTKTSLLSLLACLSATAAYGQTPPILFQDDFNTPEPDGTPSIAIWGANVDTPTVPRVTEDQWIRVTTENSEAYFGESDNGYLHLYSNGASTTGSNWISLQNNEFEGSSVISVHFDFQRASSADKTNPRLRFGKGNPIFGNSAARYSVYFHENAISLEPVVNDNTTYQLQVVYNNTTQPVTYLDGQAVVKPDSYDVWIDGVRVMTNVRYALSSSGVQPGDPLTSIGIGIWGTAQAEFRMDNLVIYDGAYAEGEPPPPDPVIVDQTIFADDFTNPTDAGYPNYEIWQVNPTRVSPPDRVLEVVDTNSELYFGESGNNYLRMFHAGATNDNFHITTNGTLVPNSQLITLSFDFYEPSGTGTDSDPMEIIPGIGTAGGSNRIHKLTLANGIASGTANAYELDQKNNVQMIFNNSFDTVTYLDGEASVASDTFDLWINGKLIMDDATFSRGTLPVGIPLASAQFIIWGSKNQEIFLDNLEFLNYPHVNNPDLTAPAPVFADDFSDPTDGKPNSTTWNRTVASDDPPARAIEVIDTDSATFFGEAGNNYMRIFNDGVVPEDPNINDNINLIAYNVFSSQVITMEFDFFEPADFGNSAFVIRPGTGTVGNTARINELTFANGSISGVSGLYQEGVENRIQIVMNNSQSPVSYLGGEGEVSSGTFDVWVNGRLVLDDHTYRAGTQARGTNLTSAMFVIWGGGSNEFLIDNLKIYDRPVVTNVQETFGFAAWAAENLPEGLRGTEDDAAGDGIPNLVKFALGLDPLAPNRDGLPQIETVSQEIVEGDVTRVETRLSITGQIYLDAEVYIVVEASNDLVNWTPLDVEPQLVEVIGADKATFRVTDTETIEASSRRFLRLNVSQD